MTKWILAALVAALGISQVSLALPVSHKDTEFQMNRGSEPLRRLQMGTQLVRNKVHVMRAVYDYSLVGGASTGTLALMDSNGQQATLPANAIIKQVLIDVLTAPTAAAQQLPTIALTAQTPGDLKASTAMATYTGLLAGTPTGTAALMIKLTASRSLKASVHASSLTGGKFNVIIEYYLTD